MTTDRLSMAVAPDVLTVDEAAHILRVSTGVVYDMIKKGKLPHRHAGRRILIPRTLLERWLLDEDRHDDARP